MSAAPHPPGSGLTARIRVAVVDDSMVVRGLFSRWLAEVPEVEIVGIHRNGLEAVRQIGRSRPDIVILDIEMPEMDGLTALPLLLEASPGSRVLVVSSMSIRGADVTLRCLMRGATDYLAKPSGVLESATSADFRTELVARVCALGARRTAISAAVPLARQERFPGLCEPDEPFRDDRDSTPPFARPARPAITSTGEEISLRPLSAAPPSLMVIGASTGGPQAVVALLSALRADIAHLPVVIAQHMPPTFTMLFADHLRRQAGLDALEIGGGELLMPGKVHIVRGGQHLSLVARGARFKACAVPELATTRWTPSIDLLFASAAKAAGAGALAALLTGMGDDGAGGARLIADAGGSVLAQDEASSVVWGMPGVAARAGSAAAVLDLPAMAGLMRRLLQKR